MQGRLTEGGISPNLRHRKGSDLFAIATNIVEKREVFEGFGQARPWDWLRQCLLSSCTSHPSSNSRSICITTSHRVQLCILLLQAWLGARGTLCVTVIAPIELMRTVQTSGIGLSTSQLASNIYKRSRGSRIL